MEFYTEPWTDGSFGPDAKKFLYSHLPAFFTGLLKYAGLQSPFDPQCLKSVCTAAAEALDAFDLVGLE